MSKGFQTDLKKLILKVPSHVFIKTLKSNILTNIIIKKNIQRVSKNDLKI